MTLVPLFERRRGDRGRRRVDRRDAADPRARSRESRPWLQVERARARTPATDAPSATGPRARARPSGSSRSTPTASSSSPSSRCSGRAVRSATSCWASVPGGTTRGTGCSLSRVVPSGDVAARRHVGSATSNTPVPPAAAPGVGGPAADRSTPPRSPRTCSSRVGAGLRGWRVVGGPGHASRPRGRNRRRCALAAAGAVQPSRAGPAARVPLAPRARQPREEPPAR